MESVSYKVTLVQSGCEPEARRFTVDRDVSTSLAYLTGKVGSLYPGLNRKEFNLIWTDSEGDKVSIKSDEELVIALTEMNGPVYKFVIELNQAKTLDQPEVGTPAGEAHPGVMCDACQGPIVGFRYKCVSCPDFDLCKGCEVKGVHPDHNMIRIATPQVSAWPHHFYRRLHRMNEMAQKKSQEQTCTNDKWCPESRPTCGRIPPFGPGSSLPSVGQRWLDSMMQAESKFFNGVHHQQSETPKDKPTLEDFIQSGMIPSGSTEFLQNLGQFVGKVLEPLGVNVQVDIETPAGERMNVNECSAASGHATSDANGCCSGMNVACKKQEGKENKNECSAASGKSCCSRMNQATNKSEGSPNKSDCIFASVCNESTKKCCSVQGNDSTPGINLLPTMTEASAQVEIEKKKKPVDDDHHVQHSDPKVEVPLQALMNMGFTNDGGWLTQLLQAKQGDIGRTLDALQPVNPNQN